MNCNYWGWYADETGRINCWIIVICNNFWLGAGNQVFFLDILDHMSISLTYHIPCTSNCFNRVMNSGLIIVWSFVRNWPHIWKKSAITKVHVDRDLSFGNYGQTINYSRVLVLSFTFEQIPFCIQLLSSWFYLSCVLHWATDSQKCIMSFLFYTGFMTFLSFMTGPPA